MDDEHLNQMLRSLQPQNGPPALDEQRVFAEKPPKKSLRPWIWVPIALAAGLLIGLWPPSPAPDTLSFRGGTSENISLELNLYRDKIAPNNRIDPQTPVPIGTIIYFELNSNQDIPIHLWAENPEKTPLGTQMVLSQPTPVFAEANILSGWQFDTAGKVTFFASPTDQCAPKTCIKIEIEAK